MTWPARILLLADVFGATQEISFRRPLAGTGTELHLRHGTGDEADIRSCLRTLRPDLLVMSRYSGADGGLWAARARARGMPVIAHLDDDLLAVPPELGARKYRDNNDPARLAALRRNLEAADLVYTSTPALKTALEAQGIAAPIRAGGLYCGVDPADLGARLPEASMPVLGYMGTSGHAADLALAVPALSRLLDRIPDLQVEVFGSLGPPAALAPFAPRVRHLPPVAGYGAFLDRLRELGWWVGLAPLADTPFNRCKAETKWVELSLAGIPVVASDMPVYRGACAGGAGWLAGDPAEWETALARLLATPALRHAGVAAAQERLRAGYGQERLRAQLAEVFATARRLAGGRGERR